VNGSAEERAYQDEARKFLLAAETFGPKFATGTASLDDFLQFLNSASPAVRQKLAQQHFGEIFAPGIHEEVLWTLKTLLGIKRGLQDSVTSQISALCKLLKKHLRFDFTKVFDIPAAWFNIRWHIKGKAALRPQAVSDHDEHLFLALRMFRSGETVSPVLIERLDIAGQQRDKVFNRRLNRACQKRLDLRPEKMLTDLQIGRLKQFLLEFWTELPEFEPTVGLCEFTYSAIGQYCSLVLDPKAKPRKDDPYERDKVSGVVRALELKLTKPASVTSVYRTGRGIVWCYKGKKRILAKR